MIFLANRSIFPNDIDTFIEFHDITASDVANIKRYKDLRLQSSRTTEEETEMNNLLNTLRDKIVTAEDWNKFCDCLVNMEVFIRDNVVGFINTKQTEMQTYVDNAVNTVNTTKDSALIAIEQKKNNVIEYLDSTTAGELRNDIGIMGDLQTINKDSLVNATNEVLSIANSKAPSSHTHTKTDITDFAHTHTVNEITNLFSNIPRTVKIEKSSKDSNGIYTQVDYKREDGTLYMRSVLSGGVSPQYATRIITIYDTDGITVLETITHTLTYDSDGNLISEI